MLDTRSGSSPVARWSAAACRRCAAAWTASASKAGASSRRRKTACPYKAAFAAALALLLAGCANLAYYAQAVGGHFELMRAARPIDSWLRDPAADPQLKEQLVRVLAIREFASRELALPDNGSYRGYADLGRPFAVWNVFAAPEFSLAPKEWCLLVVGCVGYRGYYRQEAAEELAAELRRQGFDTHVAGVPAYSTLGHFDDPVLNTFLRYGEIEVARLVFHELAHQVVFVAGDTVFNESFATAVEDEGLRRWLAAHAGPEQRRAYAAHRERKAQFAALVARYRQRLGELYDSAWPPAAKRQAKRDILADMKRAYEELKAGWGGYAGYDPWFAGEVNNARLASFALYSELVPAFSALLAAEGHDLPRFYRRVAALARQSR